MVEEVDIDKEVTSRHETVRDTVRRREVEVEDLPAKSRGLHTEDGRGGKETLTLVRCCLDGRRVRPFTSNWR